MTLQPLYKVRRRKWQKDGCRKSPSSEKRTEKDVVVEKRFFFSFYFSVRCCNTTSAEAEAELCRYTIPNPQKETAAEEQKWGGRGRENIAAARKYTEERAERTGEKKKNERLRFPFLRFILHKKIA